VSTEIKHVIYIIKRTAPTIRSSEIWLEPMHRRSPSSAKRSLQTSTPGKAVLILDNLTVTRSERRRHSCQTRPTPPIHERYWPPTYAGRSKCGTSARYIPRWSSVGRRAAQRSTYRSYGEYAARASTAPRWMPHRVSVGRHVAKDTWVSPTRHRQYCRLSRRVKAYEKNYDSPDPEKRFPNFVIMSIPEDQSGRSRAHSPLSDGRE